MEIFPRKCSFIFTQKALTCGRMKSVFGYANEAKSNGTSCRGREIAENVISFPISPTSNTRGICFWKLKGFDGDFWGEIEIKLLFESCQIVFNEFAENSRYSMKDANFRYIFGFLLNSAAFLESCRIFA